MDTSAISYRVADFLTKYAPFQAMAEADLLALSARGRVRFHEPNEYILRQGEPHKPHVFVIQQGTVTLWDETSGTAVLRDVRGAGDMLGIDRFTGAAANLHSARSACDVLVYAFAAPDFEALIQQYPHARQFVDAHDSVTAAYAWAHDVRDLQGMFLHDVVGPGTMATCSAHASVRDVAQVMLASGLDAIAAVDEEGRPAGVLTTSAVLGWVAGGAGSGDAPIAGLLHTDVPVAGPDASLVDGVLEIARSPIDALAVTSDGSSTGQLQALVTSRDLARAFGDEPVSILRAIRIAATTAHLRALNHRARALALQHLTNAPSLDWVARFISLTDVSILKRVITLAGGEVAPACWCFSGASGRGESLTRHAPALVLVADDEHAGSGLLQLYAAVADALAECDYLARVETPFDRAFHVASRTEWQSRFNEWMRDPVRAQMYLARPLFDLRPVHGRETLWRDLAATVAGAMDRDVLQLMANDCLASLPPLTFFEDAVVDESGEQTDVFRLEHSALRPLVDVGRVFGMAARHALGTSTRDRFAHARTLLPGHASIFREAAGTLRILLWQQARIGIAQGTTGSELPPSLLSRHDRHILRTGFRSILRLLEFTGNSRWFATV